MALHRDLPEDQLHEPKGVSAAVADQVYVTDGNGSGIFKPYDTGITEFDNADAGKVAVSDGAGGSTLKDYDKEPKGIDTADDNQVYVADGAGSGAWEDYVAPVTPGFASLVSQNDSSISLVAASDSTLTDTEDYVPLNNTGMWSDEVAPVNMTSSPAAGTMTAGMAGTYRATLQISAKLSVKGRIAIMFGDGVTYYPKRIIVDVGTSETNIMMDTYIPDVQQGDSAGVYIASEGDATLTIQTATFHAQRVYP